MPLIVQKFGGTSVADASKIMAAARRAIRAAHEGNQVVVVVSARGHSTDELIAAAREITDRPPAREMDMLLSTGEQVSVALMAMAVQKLGHPSISFTGTQIGIVTDRSHTRARIRSISTDRMRQALDEGKIVIAAGFQGIDEDYNITTLGRGGSDTTAVALAAVLGADLCEIYTDVEGVFTTDPRVVPDARKIDAISYDEMLELASLGAGVMHSRSIEFAQKYNVPIHVRSSFTDTPGTFIVAHVTSDEQAVVTGAARVANEARVSLIGVPDRPGVSHDIFARLADRNIAVDMIVQDVGTGGTAEVSFTVPDGDLDAAREVAAELGAEQVTYDDNVSKVSVVGEGMRRVSGVAAQMFEALAEAGVNLVMISTSEIKISVLVARADSERALRAVHGAFGLDLPRPFTPADPPAMPHGGFDASRAARIAERLAGMEDLAISNVALDLSQSRIALADIPDRPGVAARIFSTIALGGAVVDMIVQNVGRDGTSAVSFTVPRREHDRARELSRQVLGELGAGRVSSEPEIAKLSVYGIGMRSHTAVATRMFGALAARDINVRMINTSEHCVATVVENARGREALAALEDEFRELLG